MEEEELREFVENMEKIRGRHTELVTVYVPAGYNINKVAEQIKNEQSTASNIKSKTVRKNVLAALEKISQHLKNYRQTPQNGIAIFCGNISEKEGQSDIELWAVEPPEPLRQRLYRCDQTFIIDPLKELVREREIYGIVVIDKSDADIGVLKGKHITKIKHFDSLVPGKTEAGGWSQARYARVREGLLNDFMKQVGRIASQKFMEFGNDLLGVIIAGPGPVKEIFADGDFLQYEIKNKILGIVSISYSGDYGLHEAIERAEDILKDASITKEKKILDRFFTELRKDTGLAVYGFKETVKALEEGRLDILMISERFEFKKFSLRCTECENSIEKIMKEKQVRVLKCPKCGASMEIDKVYDLKKHIMDEAMNFGTETKTISDETNEGTQFKELGGIGGILRFKS
ncbi:MAG: peptide chain release factor 1 [Candidatus Micrarchaeota archaeon]|nr:peptide chain release factor 1 [Candidatus Micrarchaeota archaeon]